MTKVLEYRCDVEIAHPTDIRPLQICRGLFTCFYECCQLLIPASEAHRRRAWQYL